jgi:hypothetical protein
LYVVFNMAIAVVCGGLAWTSIEKGQASFRGGYSLSPEDSFGTYWLLISLFLAAALIGAASAIVNLAVAMGVRSKRLEKVAGIVGVQWPH